MRIFILTTIAFILTSCSTITPVVSQSSVRSSNHQFISKSLHLPSVDVHQLKSVSHLDQKEIECMALNIYHEARGEGLEGMAAVGYVTLNRVHSDRFPNLICSAVKQAKLVDNKPVLNRCQFSWYCDGLSDIPKDIKAFELAKKVAEQVILGTITNPIGTSTFYHNPTVSPNWRNVKVSGAVGNHIFYTMI